VKVKYSNPQKAHPWRKTRLLSAEWSLVTIRPPARLVGEPKKTKKKKGRKEGRKEGNKKDTKTVANWLFAQTTHVVGSK